MTPEQRVHVVTTIVDELALRDWVEVDFILGQFSIGTDDYWRGSDLKAYLYEMLGPAEAERLQALYAYLTGGVGEVGPPSSRSDGAAGPWEAGSLRLFMSHISDHAVELGSLKAALHMRGIDGFVAHVDIEPAQDWQQTILLALRTADALAAFLHPGFPESRWTDQEVGVAVARGIPIVPIVFDRDVLMPYGFLASYQALFAKELTNSAVGDRLLQILVEREPTRQRALDAVVMALERSPSYKHANKYAGMLDLITDWTPKRLDSLKRSLDNRQVAEGMVSGPKVRQLLDELMGPPF